MSADLLCRFKDVSSGESLSFIATVWETLYYIAGYLCNLLTSVPVLTNRWLVTYISVLGRHIKIELCLISW